MLCPKREGAALVTECGVGGSRELGREESQTGDTSSLECAWRCGGRLGKIL